MRSMIRFVMINPTLESFNFKAYTNELMEKVERDLDAKDVEFYSNKERIRKCSLVLNNKQYFVYFTYIITHGTFQLKIDISSEIEVKADKELHDLKIKMKDLMINEWEQCVWLEDRQSEALAEDLYKDVHSVENALRRLINTVLFYNLGGDWWEKYMPTHLTRKYAQRNDQYRERATSFKNIHTNLLSIDTGDLVSILAFKTYKAKHFNIFSEPDPFLYGFSETESNVQRKQHLQRFQYIMNNLMNDQKSIEIHQKDLTELLKEQMEVDIDFWEDYFAPWFSCTLREFKGKWTNFSMDRNHVAHNKLIDNKLYQKFKKSMKDLLTLITEAEEKFSNHLEEEMNNYLAELEEMEAADVYQRQVDFREMIEGEAGVKIRENDEIIELLQEHITNTFGSIEQEIYYRSDIEVTYNEPLLNEYETVFKIVHNITKSSIMVDVEPYIDGSEGSTSNVKFLVYYNDEIQDNFEISYTNGEAEFNEEQASYLPTIEEKLDISALKKLESIIHKLIEENMPEVPDEDLASFPCEECDEYAVNLSEKNQYGLGTCLYCGHVNPVGECLRCEAILDQPSNGLCESCEVYIEEQ
jgi:hypothetical protein